MKTYGEVEIIATLFLILTLEGDEWSASRPGRFTLEERAPVPVGYETGCTLGPGWTPTGGRIPACYAAVIHTIYCSM
jgi:hypothetical protein